MEQEWKWKRKQGMERERTRETYLHNLHWCRVIKTTICVAWESDIVKFQEIAADQREDTYYINEKYDALRPWDHT